MAYTDDQMRRILAEYGPCVWRIALTQLRSEHDAEDVYQEVFLRYFRHEHKLTDDEHRKAWLIRCTVNRANSLFTSAFRRHTVPLEAAAQIGVADEYREVYSAVLALPAKYRAVIHLFYFEGLSVAEIAAALGTAEGTVKSQLSRGRTLLREALKEVEL